MFGSWLVWTTVYLLQLPTQPVGVRKSDQDSKSANVMETRLQLLLFAYKCTSLVPSLEEGHDNRYAHRVIFHMETPSQVHASQEKKKIIATHVCRVKNIELGLSITDKPGANAFLQINCSVYMCNLCTFHKSFFFFTLELLQIVRNQQTLHAAFKNIIICGMLIYN